MQWVEATTPGAIHRAIQEAKNKRSVFVVYIAGQDEMTKKMEAVWGDAAVCQLCETEKCVALKLQANSDVCAQFCQIYPVVCVPCTFFIGTNGVPLEVIGGHLNPDDFMLKIQSAIQMHKAMLSRQMLDEEPAPTARTVPPANTQTDTSAPAHKESSAVSSPKPSSSVTSQREVSPTPGPSTDYDRQGLAPGEGVGAGGEPEEETPAELEARVQRAKELVEEQRRKKMQKEKEAEKEAEKERRLAGQQVNKFQQWKADQEAEELKKARKKEKEEERKARERVRQQIAQDRADRAARFHREKEERQGEKDRLQEAKAAIERQAHLQQQAANMETARIQFRLPDGSTVTNQFPSSVTLATARDFIQQRVGSLGQFTMSTTYPKHVFTEDEFSKTLLELGLAPAMAIIILPGSQRRSVVQGSGGVRGMLWSLFAPLAAMWAFIYNLIFGRPTQQQETYNPGASSTSQPETTTSSGQGTSSSQSGSQLPSAGPSGRPKSSYGVRKREGNIHRLSADDDDDMATWNGNSTQQM